jgi:hypothetical protein
LRVRPARFRHAAQSGLGIMAILDHRTSPSEIISTLRLKRYTSGLSTFDAPAQTAVLRA